MRDADASDAQVISGDFHGLRLGEIFTPAD